VAAAALLWAASFVALVAIDRQVPYFALAVAGYAAFLHAFRWMLS
jgi:hypothetical protein